MFLYGGETQIIKPENGKNKIDASLYVNNKKKKNDSFREDSLIF